MTYDIEFRREVVMAVMMGESRRAVARQFGVSKQSVCNWLKRIEIYKTGPVGPIKFDENVLLDYINANPDSSITDLAIEFGITFSGMHCAVKRLRENGKIKDGELGNLASKENKFHDRTLRQKIIIAVMLGDTIPDVARFYHINIRTAREWFKHSELYESWLQNSEQFNEEIALAYIARHPKKTISELARRFGLSVPEMYSALERLKDKKLLSESQIAQYDENTFPEDIKQQC